MLFLMIHLMKQPKSCCRRIGSKLGYREEEWRGGEEREGFCIGFGGKTFFVLAFCGWFWNSGVYKGGLGRTQKPPCATWNIPWRSSPGTLCWEVANSRVPGLKPLSRNLGEGDDAYRASPRVCVWLEPVRDLWGLIPIFHTAGGWTGTKFHCWSERVWKPLKSP